MGDNNRLIPPTTMGEDTNKDDPSQPLMSSTTVDNVAETTKSYAVAGANHADMVIGGGFHQGLCGCWTENLVPGGLCICCCPTVVLATLEATMAEPPRSAYLSEMLCPP